MLWMTEYEWLFYSTTVDDKRGPDPHHTSRTCGSSTGRDTCADCVRRNAMIKELDRWGPDTPTPGRAVRPNIRPCQARAKLDTALRSLMEKGRPAVGVTDAQDRLIGLLRSENLGEMMIIHSARPEVPGATLGDAAAGDAGGPAPQFVRPHSLSVWVRPWPHGNESNWS